MEADQVVRLFSYGTLRQRAVQMAVFGHTLQSRPDALPGYELALLKTTDPEVIRTSGSDEHPILRKSRDPSSKVEGEALLVTPADLVAADAYEVADYSRVVIRLASGERAYAYSGERAYAYLARSEVGEAKQEASIVFQRAR